MKTSLILAPVIFIAACGGGFRDHGPGAGPTEVGTVEAALTSVPTTVRCVFVILNPGADQASPTSFDVQPGGSTARLSLGFVPPGTYPIQGFAYDLSCAATATTASANPSWLSDPVNVTVRAATVTNVSLTFHPAASTSVSVDFAPRAVALALGASAGYAIMSDGTVRGWGSNSEGELGLGASDGSIHAPTAIPNLGGVTQLVAGFQFACALLTGGTVRCWGVNIEGQIGTGTPGSAAVATPTPVVGGHTFSQIAVGSRHACGLAADGVWCWGNNYGLQLGQPSMVTRSATPVRVPGTQHLVAIQAGSDATCALEINGRTACWGDDTSGKFCGVSPPGLYDTLRSVNIQAGSGIGIGQSFLCVLHADGSVECCGDNVYGQRGDGSMVSATQTTFVATASSYMQIASGATHACGITAAGGVECWGNGVATGDGRGANRYTPIPARGLSGAVQIAAGPFTTCALLDDGTPRCWGVNSRGALGDGTDTSHYVPTRLRW